MFFLPVGNILVSPMVDTLLPCGIIITRWIGSSRSATGAGLTLPCCFGPPNTDSGARAGTPSLRNSQYFRYFPRIAWVPVWPSCADQHSQEPGGPVGRRRDRQAGGLECSAISSQCAGSGIPAERHLTSRSWCHSGRSVQSFPSAAHLRLALATRLLNRHRRWRRWFATNGQRAPIGALTPGDTDGLGICMLNEPLFMDRDTHDPEGGSADQPV